MKRFLWLLFAHGLLFVSPRVGPVNALQSASPSTPGNFQGAAVSTTAINWTWSASTGSSIITYEVHADPETSPPTVIASGLSATTFLETGLSENTPYRRHVHARASDGTPSAASNADRKYTLIHQATTADFELSLSTNTSIKISVVEPPNSHADQTGVSIFRTVPTARSIQGFAPSYSNSDSGLQPKTQYCYNIEFQNGDGKSSGPGVTPLCLSTPDEEVPCHWDISIETAYGHEDFVKDQVVTATFPRFRPTGIPRTIQVGKNHAELEQQGTRTHHTLNMHRRDLATATIDNPSLERYQVLDANSTTTMRINYTGPNAPQLTANMGAFIILSTHGKNTGLSANWATAVVGRAQGLDDVHYDIPVDFLASDNGGADAISVGLSIKSLFLSGDIKLPVESSPTPKHLHDAGRVNKSKTEYVFTFKNGGGISAEVTSAGSGTVRTEGAGRFRHSVSFLHASDAKCSIDVSMNEDIALVTITDDLGTRSFQLRCPPALNGAGPDENFPGGVFTWTEGD